MKLILTTFVAALVMAFGTAASALTVDPSTGGSGDFFWSDGLGSSVDFGPDDTLEMTTMAAASLVVFSVEDCCVIGDEFGAVVDGGAVAWDSESGGAGTSELFTATVALILGAGTHTFDLLVTEDCCGSGAGSWTLSSATPVPVPASLPLLLAGVAGLGLLRRRNKS